MSISSWRSYASAVVEHLVTSTGAQSLRLGGESRHGRLAPLQSRLSRMGYCRAAPASRVDAEDAQAAFPSNVEVFDTGMLRPKKTLLAVFGLTRHTDRLRRLSDLVPCENCSFGPCQYRRAPIAALRNVRRATPSSHRGLGSGRRVQRQSKSLEAMVGGAPFHQRQPRRLSRRALPL